LDPKDIKIVIKIRCTKGINPEKKKKTVFLKQKKLNLGTLKKLKHLVKLKEKV
jgi:ribosomal protein L30/L7E